MSASPRLPGEQHLVYSEWEQHKLAAVGVRRLSLLALVAPLLLLAALTALHRASLAPLIPSFVGLFLTAVAGLVIYVRSLRAGVDFERPYAEATGLLLAVTVAGAFATFASGGAASVWPYGLSLSVFAWAVLMPGGLRRGWLALGGSAGLHLGIVAAKGADGMGTLAISVALQAFAAAAVTEVVEHWRLRAAGVSRADWLTGALTRGELMNRLAALLNLRQRNLEAFTVVMIDVDRFKTLNLEHGRSVGDEALELLTTTANAELRPSDLFGRLGGDEFLIVLDHCDADGAVNLVRRLQQRLAQTELNARGSRVRLSFSAGIVPMAPGDGLDLKELLSAAERALAESQEAARNRTHLAALPTSTTDQHLVAVQH